MLFIIPTLILAQSHLPAPPLVPTQPQTPYALERVIDTAAGLLTPVDIVTRPNDPNWYIVELPGIVQIYNGQTLEPTPFLDLTATVSADGLTGLRGFVFHPLYHLNGYVYTWFDFRDANQNLFIGLARMTRSAANPNQVDPASFVELLRSPQDARGHGSSRLEFGPDGMLYAMLGDGGLQQDPNCNGQNGLTMMASMIRIDVDGGFPYAIPPDNPFVGDPNILDEAWHVGLRHPWRWSFDRATGDLWIADVGQFTWEEINFVPQGVGGKNFGWSVKEGTDCFLPTTCLPAAPGCQDPIYTDPFYQYDHTQGCSITGGFVYRGSALPQAYGRYFFADFCTGKLWSLAHSGQQVLDVIDHTPTLFSLNGGQLNSPVAFAEDHDGELLIIDYAGREVFRLVPECLVRPFCDPSPNSQGHPARLSASGTSDVSANDLVLHTQGMPPFSFGHPFMGSGQTSLALGGGQLCISATNGYVRLPIFVGNSAGRAHIPLDYTLPPLNSGPGQVLAGTRWNFQIWYRDSGAPAGSNSNLTNALAVYFCD